MSEQKVRVTKLLGGGETNGLMDGRVNMLVHHGIDARYIKNIAADGATVGLAKTQGGTEVGRAYPHELFVTMAEATGVWSYPTGDGSIQFGHHGIFPNGVPEDATHGSGVAYFGGDGEVHVFGR